MRIKSSMPIRSSSLSSFPYGDALCFQLVLSGHGSQSNRFDDQTVSDKHCFLSRILAVHLQTILVGVIKSQIRMLVEIGERAKKIAKGPDALGPGTTTLADGDPSFLIHQSLDAFGIIERQESKTFHMKMNLFPKESIGDGALQTDRRKIGMDREILIRHPSHL